jgi:hypothetical protein
MVRANAQIICLAPLSGRVSPEPLNQDNDSDITQAEDKLQRGFMAVLKVEAYLIQITIV